MMRYRLATIVIVISFFVLTGCAGGKPGPTNSPLPAGIRLDTMDKRLTDLIGQLEGLK